MSDPGIRYHCICRWTSTEAPPSDGWGLACGSDAVGLRRQPAVDWVRQDQYERYLREAFAVLEEDIRA
jgi:hypothetical protein